MKLITFQPAGKDKEDKEQTYLFSIDGKPLCPIGSVNFLILEDSDQAEKPNQKEDKDNG